MKRIAIAWILLILSVSVAGAGSWIVHQSFKTMNEQLISAQEDCLAGNYQTTLEKAHDAEHFFAQREHLLALFLRRDYLREIQTTLSGLPAYACEEYANDFLCESNQAIHQLDSVKHLFFSII